MKSSSSPLKAAANTDTARLAAFQAKQRADRRAAGIPEKTQKGQQNQKRKEYLFDAALAFQPNSVVEKLCAERRSHWLERRALQYAWTQALEMSAMYRQSDTIGYLHACGKKAVSCSSIILLNRIEEVSLGSVVTAGSFAERKLFWTFIGHQRRNHTPPELLAIVNIEAAAQVEYEAAVIAGTVPANIVEQGMAMMARAILTDALGDESLQTITLRVPAAVAASPALKRIIVSESA